MQLLKK